MKGGREKAHVFIDIMLNDGRKKFTLAHELGHLVIPWHVGSTVDTIDLPIEGYEFGFEYYQIESEANKFAAELLMPSAWVKEKAAALPDLAELHRSVTQQAEVSLLAAAIRLTRFLPIGTVWVMEREGMIISKGQTGGTRTPGIWEKDVPFDNQAYPYALAHYQWVQGNTTTHWWTLPSEISVQEDDPREWRDVLDDVLISFGYLETEWPAIKLSINGVIGGINGALKSQSKRDETVLYSPEALAAMCVRQFAESKWAEFLQLPDMHLYIIKRAKDLFESPREAKKLAL
jgi:hypothetical protein